MEAKTAPDPFRQLKAAYDSRRLVLALGAGVSVGCGLPDWTRLLRSLVRKYVPFPRPSYDALADYFDHNPAVIAGLVRDRFPNRKAFADAIRHEFIQRRTVPAVLQPTVRADRTWVGAVCSSDEPNPTCRRHPMR